MPVSPRDLQHHPLVAAIARALRRPCRVQPHQRMLVAVSGGADSVALLRALHLLHDRRTFNLVLAVGHVQHHLRGEQSEADAQFVEQLATELDLPLLRADLDLSTPAPANLHAIARRQRYNALYAMAQAFDAPVIATAHHADDQLETLLMRILRGASVAGLRATAVRRPLRPSPAQPTAAIQSPDLDLAPSSAATPDVHLIRPMLHASAALVRDLLEQLDQTWREDPSNADLTRTRSRVRHQVLPILRDLAPQVAVNACRITHDARQLHALLQRETARHHEHVIEQPPRHFMIDRTEARLMPPLVLSQLLRQLLTQLDCPPDRLTRRTLDPIRRAIRDRAGHARTFDLPNQITVTITRDHIQIAPSD